MKKLLVVTITALTLILAACTPDDVTVTFDSDGGTAVTEQTIQSGTAVDEPADPAKTGYEFEYWYLDDDTTAYAFDSSVEENVTLTAKWRQLETYTVTFDAMGGDAVDAQTITEGDLVDTPSAIEKDGYDFVYWYSTDDTTAFDFTTVIDGDVTLTAKWTEKEVFTVAFDANGGDAVDSQSVVDGELATDPGAIETSGFNFLYWYLDDEMTAFDFATPITAGITLTAKWEAKDVFTVTFDATVGAAVDPINVFDGELLAVPSAPEAPEHNFVHWYLDDENTAFDASTPITSDITLTAKWTDRPVYTVTFDSNGGSAVAAQNVMEGYMPTVPDMPEQYGYSFVRWYETDDTVAYDFSAPVMGDVSLTAAWSLKPTYTVSFATGDGSAVDAQSIIEDEVVAMPDDPTLAGFRFMYWYSDDENTAFDFATGITADTVLTAKWGAVFTVSFDSDSGSAVDAVTLLATEVTVAPEDPTRVGYRFEHWYLDDPETPFVFGAVVDTDITLTAKWQKVYLIRFYSFGQILDSYNVDSGTVITPPDVPEREDYVFLHWYTTDSEVAYDFSAPITASANFFARWETPTERLIMEDMDAYALLLDGVTDFVPTPDNGSVQGSSLKFYSESPYLTDSGVILPLPKSMPAETTGSWRVRFSLNGESYYRTYEVPLQHVDDVVIENSRVLPFQNLTTEYTIADGDLTLYFEENGSVPYVKLDDFFTLLQGFIDPALPMTFTPSPDSLEIFYQYYDEDEDYTYDLILTIDATENTITTNDPGFYWAYIYSTETNYGRHIEYVQDHPDESYIEGSDVVYDLDDYNMDIVMYEGEVLLPYYMTNQLFAGSAYYNVYYNYDALYGIYSLPSDNGPEMSSMMNSSQTNQDIPWDLLHHTFDMLAFDLNNLYGLKDVMDVDNYYDYLYTVADDLFTQDSEELEVGIRDVLLKGMDEPHTSYGYFSYYNNASQYDGPVTNSLSVYGPRFVGWYYDGLIDTDDVIGAKWGESTDGSWNVSRRPNYWWVSDDVVMLSLDGFVTSDMEESATYDGTISASMLDVADATSIVPTIAEGTKFFYYNNSDETRDIMDILVKGVSTSYVDSYKADLVTAGYTLVQETTTTDSKIDGYYTKTIGDVDYMIVVHYDSEYDVLHVGVASAVPALYNSGWLVSNEVYPLIDADSAVYLEFMLQEIEEENPDFTNIILDISWNTGGNVGALYRVLGFITDQPFEVSGMDGDTGGASTYYVDITGVPDYSHLNWYLLTTPTSFSAANSLANIFKVNELGTVIGVQTGGGACSITPILLPNGTAFTMSSNNISAYRTGSGTEEDPYVYHDVEFGITPDVEIPINDIFTTSVLLEIINGSN